MNLEKDVSPTGLYNYLPKVRTIRRRKPRKPRTTRSKMRGGNPLEALKTKVTEALNNAENDSEPAGPALVAEARRVMVEDGVTLGNLYSALKKALV
jgi:hypothetical protein